MEAGSYPRHRGPLYRFCILVHGINQFCQSRRDGSEVAHGHVFRHPTRRGSCIYSRTACWCGRGFTFLPVAIRCCSFDADKRGLEVKQCQRTTAFRVQVRGNHITVTFVGTSFCVDYPKSKKGQAVLPLGFSKPADATSAQVAGFSLGGPRE